MLHELIDREDPKCLYCNSDVQLKIEGQLVGAFCYNTNIITCCQCKEFFEIRFTQNPEGETSYDGFFFSCNGIFVFNYYSNDFFHLSTKKYDPNESIFNIVFSLGEMEKIPKFDISFSDKKKLHEKLRTYLLFS